MTTLHALGLTPSHLTPAAQNAVIALKGNSCAWKTRRGWRPKNPSQKDFQGKTGDYLIGRQLAMVHITKGSPRLVLTSAGEEMAVAIATARRSKKGKAA